MLGKLFKKTVCLMVAGMFLCISSGVEAATSGKVGSSAYCTVKINQSLIKKKGKQYATVKLVTQGNLFTMNTGARVKLTLRDGNGRYITSWVGKGGNTLKLGDDHSVYRIYVDYYDKPGGMFTQANNWTNRGKADKWLIKNPKNCTIY